MLVFPQALLSVVSPDLPGGTAGLRLLAVATIVTTVTGPSGAVILYAGKSIWNLAISVLAFVLMLSVAMLAVPAHGANGASLAWAAAITLQSVIGCVVTRRAFGLDPFRPRVLRLALWSAMLAVPAEITTWLVLGDTVSGLLIGVALGGALILGVNQLTAWSHWGDTTPA